ncbi:MULTISPECIES: hypothetical protein [Geomicrobium]|uniref:Uncharacterized membrane protein YuzA (DUF378 family) n=1 Tax=Geomicrobium sediminis TaxID=1347788 RepID=A0ABS2PHM2_9BACL|nr:MULTISPECIES: hypothetical protein [Geomicrobium]MBM7634927.1 uncharacterized membrane protein YuzA (DUF378 family) [Geomicrobium sediminis]GAK10275.1 hypothetical protein JCM19038_4164 [Geomicrobium sp. JCM 19038]
MSLKTFENITMGIMIVLLILAMTGAVTGTIIYVLIGVAIVIIMINLVWRVKDYKKRRAKLVKELEEEEASRQKRNSPDSN